MCESNVYLNEDEEEKLIMEDAVLLENRGGKLKFTNILGEEKEMEGRIEEITFLDHKIVIGT